MKLGKTNNYPRGKLNKDDEGGVRIAIGILDNTVIIDFGTHVTWLGMDYIQALQLADSIKEKALFLQTQHKGNKNG